MVHKFEWLEPRQGPRPARPTLKCSIDVSNPYLTPKSAKFKNNEIVIDVSLSTGILFTTKIIIS
jgi:hypothetical protein